MSHFWKDQATVVGIIIDVMSQSWPPPEMSSLSVSLGIGTRLNWTEAEALISGHWTKLALLVAVLSLYNHYTFRSNKGSQLAWSPVRVGLSSWCSRSSISLAFVRLCYWWCFTQNRSAKLPAMVPHIPRCRSKTWCVFLHLVSDGKNVPEHKRPDSELQAHNPPTTTALVVRPVSKA